MNKNNAALNGHRKLFPPPMKQNPRRLLFAKKKNMAKLLIEMQQKDIIEPLTSPWASPIILGWKKNGFM